MKKTVLLSIILTLAISAITGCAPSNTVSVALEDEFQKKTFQFPGDIPLRFQHDFLVLSTHESSDHAFVILGDSLTPMKVVGWAKLAIVKSDKGKAWKVYSARIFLLKDRQAIEAMAMFDISLLGYVAPNHIALEWNNKWNDLINRSGISSNALLS